MQIEGLFEPACSRHEQVRSGDKSVKSLSVKRPQADFFLSPCQKQLKKLTECATM